MKYFFAPGWGLLLSVCSMAQTTICLIKGDTVFAGGTDKSRISSVEEFNFIYDGPLDSMITAKMSKVAAGSPDFKTLTAVWVQVIKEGYTAYFSYILQKNPDYFDRQIMGGQVSRVVGQTCLFGIELDKPVLTDIVFYLNKGVKHPVVISYSISEQRQAIFSTVAHPGHKGVVGSLPDRGPVGQIKRMIGFMLDGPVDGTGPPIDVLVVTAKGKMWIRK